MKHNSVHLTYIPEEWDKVTEISILVSNIKIKYVQNGFEHTKYFKEDLR